MKVEKILCDRCSCDCESSYNEQTDQSVLVYPKAQWKSGLGDLCKACREMWERMVKGFWDYSEPPAAAKVYSAQPSVQRIIDPSPSYPERFNNEEKPT